MKTIFNFALAAVLATTFYLYSDAKVDTNAVAAPAVEEEYRFVDEEHDLFNQTRTRDQILQQNLCPGALDVCATPEPGSSGEAIMWDGPENKF